jgi:hypothetical protein
MRQPAHNRSVLRQSQAVLTFLFANITKFGFWANRLGFFSLSEPSAWDSVCCMCEVRSTWARLPPFSTTSPANWHWLADHMWLATLCARTPDAHVSYASALTDKHVASRKLLWASPREPSRNGYAASTRLGDRWDGSGPSTGTRFHRSMYVPHALAGVPAYY